LKGTLDAMNTHDAKKFASFFAEDGAFWHVGREPARGRAAIQEANQKLYDAFSNAKFGLNRVWQKGDVAIAELVMTGTHSGEWRGVKPTEKPVGEVLLAIFSYAPDGLVKEERYYADDANILAQVGAWKQRARPIPALPTSTEWYAAKGAPEEEKAAELARQSYAAFEKKAEADWLALLHDDADWDDLTFPTPMRTRSDFKKYFAVLHATFSDLKVSAANVWGVENYVIAEGTFAGTNTGPVMGGPAGGLATKKPVTLHGVDVAEVRNGKWLHGWSYSNGLEMLSQLGLFSVAKSGSVAAPKK
jgi:uncharacterized protein (TIGR02246 family)